MLNWIKLEPGCEMPDYDEFVLWRDESGLFFVREIDKDDNDWWNVDKGFGKITHYAQVIAPDEQPDQDMLWSEIKELVWKASLHAYLSAEAIEQIKIAGYIISRK